ncbi:interleukin-1 receptor antagonist protein-like isoform X1 [Rhineura floridana]|uniref:interleukin-1 receptor antagonist protein-like isoform X1 n=1 Tax=Rhineura floridana TaxID=261503 RepID=UPI002AC82CD3|nr:interleukin-1 receptor antagonist protein-like isoform X1 [Rhineura floridana]XP_061448606.1 interleukin-1 receptor antagonist protein-like isoform X1 [Rhineura floridana]XP_061448607.1 interleukin-1 receptor antagonist protein-like isoform X1 [Rhineura floridana]XP_061448608.1 interleukin-1 receptor antagonist protein-like isoform X1 [Rhineura floridana]
METVETETLMAKPNKMTVDQKMKDLFHHFSTAKPHLDVHNEVLDKPWFYKIWDVDQKFLFLHNNMVLAAPRDSNSPDYLFTVTPNSGIKEKENIFPIFIGTHNGARTLSCVESGGGQPQLNLEDRGIMDLYREKQELKSFTFFCKSGSSKETGSFQSAAFPGWFISTSSEPNKPISLSHQGGAEITEFYFEKTKS